MAKFSSADASCIGIVIAVLVADVVVVVAVVGSCCFFCRSSDASG